MGEEGPGLGRQVVGDGAPLAGPARAAWMATGWKS
jgi:hypothetical protein